MDTLTTKDLLAKLRLKSPETLRRWREAGLIDSPTIEPLAEGRGRIARWPAQAFAQAMDVREKLKSGMTLEQVIAANKPKSHRPYRAKEVFAKLDRQGVLFRFRDQVTSLLRQFSRQNLGALGSELIMYDHLTTAEAIEGQGQRPVLIVFENSAVVLTVKEVGKWLDQKWPVTVLAIIPVDLNSLRQ